MHIHRYEKYWLYFGIGSLIIFLAIIGFSAYTMGQQPPSHLGIIDPEMLEQTPPFDQPGVKKIDEETYEATIIAFTFGYSPNKIEVPVGKRIIFQVTSKDVVHSFTIPKTNVNMMITPGHINVAEHTFKEPGKYLVLCNEYCGAAHEYMQMEIEVVE